MDLLPLSVKFLPYLKEPLLCRLVCRVTCNFSSEEAMSSSQGLTSGKYNMFLSQMLLDLKCRPKRPALLSRYLVSSVESVATTSCEIMK